MAEVKPVTERNTRQKQAIREVFLHAARPLSVEEVVDAASEGGEGVSLPTVYRSVRSLLAEGWLALVELPGRTPVYETAEREHHHHFTCVECDRVFELMGCATFEMKPPQGFVVLDHEITVMGYCRPCAQLRRSTKAKRK